MNEKVKQWTQAPFDQETITAVNNLKSTPEALEDAFYKNLDFGTGGMRGVMGVGTNRINPYTLGKNTQGLSNYLKKTFDPQTLRVVIAYDCRKNSQYFAQRVAEVFSANGIDVYVFPELRPTPALSFAVRHLNAHCGIVLTASHNPPEYNGYKVYWKDGGQIVPPQDKEIIEEIEKIDFQDILFEAQPDKIHRLDASLDQAFIQQSLDNAVLSQEEKEGYSIVFTSLHGTAVTLLPQTLSAAGFTQVYSVKAQEKPDGNFPTVSSPNPEEKEALALGLTLADEKKADLLLGFDPDADRLGIGVRDTNGEMILLNGNQTMVAITRYLLEYKKEKNQLGENAFIGSTVVSTPMMKKLADHFGIDCKLGLTGFKWIAKMIEDFPDEEFICGGEESYGFMVGHQVRDKDAITSALLVAEIGAQLKKEGKSFYSYLLETYQSIGCYQETLISFTKKGKSGAEEIQRMMENYRNQMPQEFGGDPVKFKEDYSLGLRTYNDGTTAQLSFPKADVLVFETLKGYRVCIRPSGTEPKIKFYLSVNSSLENTTDFPEVWEALKSLSATISKSLGL